MEFLPVSQKKPQNLNSNDLPYKIYIMESLPASQK